MDFSKFSVITFDCYGTLIDWETGIWDAVSPVLAAHGVTLAKDGVLELYGTIEAGVQQGSYRTYKSVLREVMEQMGAELSFVPTPDERDAITASLGDWPPFSDTVASLAALAKRYKLAIISNTDDDLFAKTSRRLGAPFSWIITAEQVRAYKPSTENFRFAMERIGVPREQILHVAQSVFHDVAPAQSLGLSTVWVNRRRGKGGAGATPKANATPDLEVPDLKSLVALMGLGAV